MSNQMDITIPSEAFKAIGKIVGSDFSVLSPFNIEAAGSLANPPKEVLRGNTLREDLLPVFQTLAQTQAMGACAYLGAGALMDVSYYYPAADQQSALPVSLAMAEDGIHLQSPADVGSVAAGLGQLIGQDMVRICEFAKDLPLNEAYVLFALVDAVRRRTFAGLAGSDSGDLNRIPIDEVASVGTSQADDEIGHLQWLAPHFAASSNIAIPAAADVEKELHALAKGGLVKLQNKEVVLSEELADLVTNLLTVSGHIRLQAAHLNGKGSVQATEVRGIRGQDNAWLLWTDDGKQAQFMGASPAQVIAILRDMLGSPDGRAPQAAAVQTNPSPAKDGSSSEADKKKNRAGKKRRWWKIVLIVAASLIALWAIVYAVYSALYY